MRSRDTRLDPTGVGRYVLMPGDPGRVYSIIEWLDNPRLVFKEAEHLIYTGEYHGIQVTVASTGIGGPPTAVVLTALVNAGADTFIRLGGAGGLQPQVAMGDLVIATGAIRDEGTGQAYLPLAFPAVADFEIAWALADAAKKYACPHHLGIVHSKDSFQSQVAPEKLPNAQRLQWEWEAWLAGNTLASEMESAALFIASQTMGVRAGAVFLVRHSKDHSVKAKVEDFGPAIQVCLGAIELLDQQE